jgi:hypothetical protein
VIVEKPAIRFKLAQLLDDIHQIIQRRQWELLLTGRRLHTAFADDKGKLYVGAVGCGKRLLDLPIQVRRRSHGKIMWQLSGQYTDRADDCGKAMG